MLAAEGKSMSEIWPLPSVRLIVKGPGAEIGKKSETWLQRLKRWPDLRWAHCRQSGESRSDQKRGSQSLRLAQGQADVHHFHERRKGIQGQGGEKAKAESILAWA